MEKNTISMYLVYWLNVCENEEAVNNFLKSLSLKDFIFEKVKCGDQCIKSPILSLNTASLDEVTIEFLNLYCDKIKDLNLIADKFDGKFVLNIVPKMYENQTPQLTFYNKFLKFFQSIKNFYCIDIDQYFY